MTEKGNLPRQGQELIELYKNNSTFIEINLCTDYHYHTRFSYPCGKVPTGCRRAYV